MTKIVTALVVMEACELSDVATVSSTAASEIGSEVGLRAGERMTVGELLKGLMLPSGNDAAVCLAEHVAGTEASFAERMTAKAAELGAVDSHFKNASGLTQDEHYSCARDMAVFALAARLDPYLSDLMKQTTAVLKWESGRTATVKSTNRLLGQCDGCDGVKTGYTTAAGRCLAASATRSGYGLVSVVMKSPDCWAESGKLLNWGFGQPPIAVVKVTAPASPTGQRFNAPIIDGRLHVPADAFMQALGCSVKTVETALIATVGGQHLTFTPGGPLYIDGYGDCPAVANRSWNGRAVAPAGALCRLLGLSLGFDRPTLTATVGP